MPESDAAMVDKTTTPVDVVRLNINLNAETAAALRSLAAVSGISVTEAVRRAVSVYKYVADEKTSGRRILTTDADRNDVREIVLF